MSRAASSTGIRLPGTCWNRELTAYALESIRTSRQCLFLLLVSVLHCLAFASGDTLEVIESHTLHLRFSYPQRFVIGSYDTTNDVIGHFRNQIVVVDPKELGKYSRTAIPIGDLPTISIGVESDTAGILLKPFTDIEIVKKFFSRDIKEPEFKRKIGAYTVYQLPGYPGPYGESAYYFLVPLPDGRYVELSAPKYFFGRKINPRTEKYPETHYDRVIEIIISSMKG